ncbi:MAG: enoyl-[acyl-carrier-protein] reductase FabK [Firmicutes bacterium]|nr:enoyl-[acyl-carrier-protein] reductase FabK [Bacillota bacterium]
MRTQLCELLGIEYPILQGGMAWIATAELAAAVSNAGGLGIIGAGNMPPELLAEEINKAKAYTDRPFGVNVYYLSPYVEEIIETVIKARVPVIATGAGNPGKHIPRLQAIGSKVIPVVPSVALAKRLTRLGVDAVIAEGMEAGGHIGELTTMALVPQIVDAVDVPVIAAGGIADGRGMAAALSLGAQGVQVGTRFVCARECTVHPNFKNMILHARDRDTVVTGASTGHPVRVLKNHFSRKFKQLEASGLPKEELEALGIGRLRKAAREGDVENGSVMAGQIAGLVKKEMSAAEIIKEMVTEAQRVFSGMKGV